MRPSAKLLQLLTLSLAACGGGGGTVAPPPPPPPPPPPAPVASVAIAPAGPLSLQVAGTSQLSATPKDAAGNALSRAVTWSSSASGIASVSTTGLLTAAAAGTAQITATSEGIAGQVSVTVTEIPVASVSLSATTGTLVPAQTLLLTATPKDVGGAALLGRTVTWSTSSGAVATVSTSGTVTGVAPGTATITATVEGKTANAVMTVGDGGLVGSAGGAVSAASGKVGVTLPAGAVSSGLAITVSPDAAPPADPNLIAGTVYEFGPSGTTFAVPSP